MKRRANSRIRSRTGPSRAASSAAVEAKKQPPGYISM